MKVLLSKTNFKSAPEKDKRGARKNSSPEKKTNLWNVKGRECFFFWRKFAEAVPIFTLFNFFPLQT